MCLSDVEFHAESIGDNRFVIALRVGELWSFESEILADLGVLCRVGWVLGLGRVSGMSPTRNLTLNRMVKTASS